MPVIDLVNLRRARNDLDTLIDWLHNIPMMGMSTNSDFHSLELALTLVDDEIRRFENRMEDDRFGL